MACTTILVGKKASYDGSTMIARNDDSPSGKFEEKKLIVVERNKNGVNYKTKENGLEIELPKESARYTLMPNVNPKDGIWGAAGINEYNVGMTATETITSNPIVLGADPLTDNEYLYEKPTGIGEEDLVVLVLPYIKSAKEGVLRLGELLEIYGTYESNGIAFNDKDSIWWLETIGGHHWIAKRVRDEDYVVMPNQFGLDEFDFKDAFGAQKENLCSKDLKEFIIKNHLDLNLDDDFNPRLAFGSHDDSDHVYNTPRAWFMERYLNPRTFEWNGPHADYTPESDDIRWSLTPERKITIEDIKYLLGSYYQGTPFNPYDKNGMSKYRPIGISRTSFMAILQIRGYVDKKISAIEWVAFGSNAFNSMTPIYANTNVIPAYFNNTTLDVNTNNYYWNMRLLAALADAHFKTTAIFIERYQDKVATASHYILNKYDKLIKTDEDIVKANEELANMVEEETKKALSQVLYTASMGMKNGFSRSDN